MFAFQSIFSLFASRTITSSASSSKDGTRTTSDKIFWTIPIIIRVLARVLGITAV